MKGRNVDFSKATKDFAKSQQNDMRIKKPKPRTLKMRTAPNLLKNEYLYYVGVMNTSKEETQWRRGFQAAKPKTKLVPKKPRKKKTPWVKKFGNIAEVLEIGCTTKVEEKALIQEQK